MLKISTFRLLSWISDLITSFCSGVIFYTIIPLPSKWTSNWTRIARWVPIIGLMLGSLLILANQLFVIAKFPLFTRNALIVAIWIGVTGGLHLDGAMDTADGLAVPDTERQLEVMRDSSTGAFGAISAVIILLLKTVSLSEMSLPLWLALISATSWSRLGQVWAIAFYPYLRKTGKGSFHKENLQLPQDLLVGLICLLMFSCFWFTATSLAGWQIIIIVVGNITISLTTGYYFNRQLGGHTGDTYGAVVEWNEVLILCFLTAF